MNFKALFTRIKYNEHTGLFLVIYMYCVDPFLPIRLRDSSHPPTPTPVRDGAVPYGFNKHFIFHLFISSLMNYHSEIVILI